MYKLLKSRLKPEVCFPILCALSAFARGYSVKISVYQSKSRCLVLGSC